MIYIYSTSMDDTYTLDMPYEINNQFLGSVDRMSLNAKIPYDFKLLGVSDFGDVIIPYEKMENYIIQLNSLIENLDDVIKYCPLPETIWGFDLRMFPKYICPVDNIDHEIPVPASGIPFSKEEMLVFLNALKKKAIEAKNKNAGLKFAGD